MEKVLEQTEREIALQALNQNPDHFLGQETNKIKVGEKYCKVVRDNLKGGIVVFCPGGIVHLHWDRENRKWF